VRWNVEAGAALRVTHVCGNPLTAIYPLPGQSTKVELLELVREGAPFMVCVYVCVCTTLI